jgi:ATP-binding cassette subfamily F protein 3
VQVGYFAQAHELLNPKSTLIDEIIAAKPMGLAEARNYLGQFLFSGDDVFRTIDTLSGGERGRVALAKLALSGANLLLLDEPTNHLDIESQEILQNVLASFDGTILLVSHDRYLIDALATQIWAASPDTLQVFEGNYKEYVEARDKAAQAEKSPPPTPPHPKGTQSSRNGEGRRGEDKNGTSSSKVQAKLDAAPKKKHGLNAFQLERKLKEVEANIESLEARIADLHDAITQASTAGDAARIQSLGAEYNQAEADLEAAMGEWELLME